MKKISVLIFLVLSVSLTAWAQSAQPPFYNEIQSFKKEDSLKPPPANAILFVGSSSFRMWQNVQQAFPEHTIINRGFGGSSLPHVIRYADDIIFPYHAKQIVIYAGENDLTESDTISAQTVYGRFQHLFHLIREKQPNTPIVFVSIKPSPSRAHLMPKMVEANRLIQAFIKDQKKASFVNVYPRMLNGDGKPKPEIFLADSLHMNENGYAIWKKALKPHLKK
jgi:lysophospholipase L1-like esterase